MVAKSNRCCASSPTGVVAVSRCLKRWNSSRMTRSGSSASTQARARIRRRSPISSRTSRRSTDRRAAPRRLKRSRRSMPASRSVGSARGAHCASSREPLGEGRRRAPRSSCARQTLARLGGNSARPLSIAHQLEAAFVDAEPPRPLKQPSSRARSRATPVLQPRSNDVPGVNETKLTGCGSRSRSGGGARAAAV